MTPLIARLREHDQEGREYRLDYVTLYSGFTYRNVIVKEYDDNGILALWERPKDHKQIELYLKATEVASAQIITY